MPEPTSTGGISYAIAAVLAVIFGSQFPIIDPETLIGAVGGGIVFVMFDNTFTILKRLFGMVVSILIGYIGAPELMAHTPIQTPGIAAFIISACLIVATVLILGKIKSGDFSLFRKGKP